MSYVGVAPSILADVESLREGLLDLSQVCFALHSRINLFSQA